MGLLAQAKADIEQITSDLEGFAAVIVFVALNNSTATVNGLHTKHHLGIDTEGNRVNVKNAHISVSEKFLTDAGYPVRNSDKEVSLINHKVTVSDSTGESWTYLISECFPNETIGLLTCILVDFE